MKVIEINWSLSQIAFYSVHPHLDKFPKLLNFIDHFLKYLSIQSTLT